MFCPRRTGPVPNEISPNVAFGVLTTVADYSAFVARITERRGDAFDLKPRRAQP